MKILYGYPWYPSEAYGNVQDITDRYLERLRLLGYDISGFCLTLNPPSQCLTFPELDYLWKRKDKQLMILYDSLFESLNGCDIFFNASGINLHPEFVSELPVFTVFGCNDDPENSKNLSQPAASSYDLCMIGNIAEVSTYRSWGVKNVEWLPMGLQPGMWDTTLTAEEILNGTRDVDLFMMIDRKFPIRKSRLDYLANKFPEGYFFGNGWERGYLAPGEELGWLKRAKIGPNLHNSTGPINFRTFYLPANGVMQICDNKNYLSSLYVLDEEVVGFDSIQECVDKCNYYLAHDNERKQIALNGWKRALNDYTEDKVFKRFIDTVDSYYVAWRNTGNRDRFVSAVIFPPLNVKKRRLKILIKLLKFPFEWLKKLSRHPRLDI